MTMQVRRLTEGDAQAYRDIRLEALEHCPEAFQATYERSANLPLEAFASRLERYALFGGFEDGKLQGMAGLYPMHHARTAHKGILWGLYVREAARGSGVADKIVEAVLDYARDEVEQVHVSVITANERALGFFARLGFQDYGTEPRAIKIGDIFYDERFFVKRLT